MSRDNKQKKLDYYLKLRYKVEITPVSEEEGGGYEASIPQLGRMAFRGYGKTIDEALSHLEVVKRDLFERYQKKGVEIPEPAAREEKYSGRILLRIPYYLHKELAQLAQKENISLNQLLNHLIERGLASLKYQNQVVDVLKMFQNISPWYKPEFIFRQIDVDINSHCSSISEKPVDYKQSVC
ncbi:MAG: toxin-antitoxin system HicB family antitoxin [Candidatus Saccharicenans sp.]|nr:toxin-antitoxin system HicB family antitoxin [Candidatus Saccharicenans sp.]